MVCKHPPEKKCKVCQQIKLREEFYTEKSGPKTGHLTSGLCKLCYKIHKASKKVKKFNKPYKAQIKKQTKEEAKETKNIYRKKKFSETKEYLGSVLKGAKCHDCPQTNLITFHFDHRDPSQKSFGISDSLSRVITLDKVKAEVAKCDIVCANCHAIRTAKMFGSWRLDLYRE